MDRKTRKQKQKQQKAFEELVQNAVDFNRWQFRDYQPLTEEELKKFEEDLIAEYGKKGLNFVLCRCAKPTLCQNQANRRECAFPNLAPFEFLFCGKCKFSLKVRDGIIYVDEQ